MISTGDIKKDIAVLQSIASIIRTAIRESDTAEQRAGLERYGTLLEEIAARYAELLELAEAKGLFTDSAAVHVIDVTDIVKEVLKEKKHEKSA